ncbi:Coronin, partial [Gryllus bimaculatus]
PPPASALNRPLLFALQPRLGPPSPSPRQAELRGSGDARANHGVLSFEQGVRTVPAAPGAGAGGRRPAALGPLPLAPAPAAAPSGAAPRPRPGPGPATPAPATGAAPSSRPPPPPRPSPAPSPAASPAPSPAASPATELPPDDKPKTPSTAERRRIFEQVTPVSETAPRPVTVCVADEDDAPSAHCYDGRFHTAAGREIKALYAAFVPPRPGVRAVIGDGRVSKFRHLKGTPLHKSTHIENVRNVSRQVSGECDGFRANAARAALPLAGAGGKVAVLELARPGRLPDGVTPALVHGAAKSCAIFTLPRALFVLLYNPWGNGVLGKIMTCDDGAIRLWRVPPGGLAAPTNEPETTLVASADKLLCLAWHPLAADVLAVAAFDATVRVWDLAAGAERVSLTGHGDQTVSKTRLTLDCDHALAIIFSRGFDHALVCARGFDQDLLFLFLFSSFLFVLSFLFSSRSTFEVLPQTALSLLLDLTLPSTSWLPIPKPFVSLLLYPVCALNLIQYPLRVILASPFPLITLPSPAVSDLCIVFSLTPTRSPYLFLRPYSYLDLRSQHNLI